MKKSSKDVEAYIEEYLRKTKSAGTIDEFITACQNLKALILDVKNKGKAITSKDLFSNTKSRNTLKEPSSANYGHEGSIHHLKNNGPCQESNIHDICLESLDNTTCTDNNKPNQTCCTRVSENPPTLNESDSDDILHIIAKLKLAHLISPSVDKYTQTEEFQKNVALFEKGKLEELEISYATTSSKRKASDSKLETCQINDDDVSELKLVSSDDHSNSSSVIEKPIKLSNDTNNDKTNYYLKNDIILGETDTDLRVDKYSQQTGNTYHSKLEQEDVIRLPFKPEIYSNIDEPQTSKCVKQIEKQKLDNQFTDQSKPDIFGDDSTVNMNMRSRSQGTIGLFERKVREVIKTKKKYNKDGTINEVTEATIITKHIHNPVGSTLVDNLKIQPVISDEEKLDQFEMDDVNFCTAPKHNMQGFIEGKEKKVKQEKFSNNCKVALRAESYIKQCLSCSDVDRVKDIENEADSSKKVPKEKT